MNNKSAGYNADYYHLVVSALQGSAVTAAERHNIQASILVKKAFEIADEAMARLHSPEAGR